MIQSGRATFTDSVFDVHDNPGVPGGGRGVMARYPAPPPGRRYVLEQDANGGCSVVLVSIAAPARTGDATGTIAAWNDANRRFWERPVGPKRP